LPQGDSLSKVTLTRHLLHDPGARTLPLGAADLAAKLSPLVAVGSGGLQNRSQRDTACKTRSKVRLLSGPTNYAENRR
jgi:hypothetical protein